jgi:hypothetical protein
LKEEISRKEREERRKNWILCSHVK